MPRFCRQQVLGKLKSHPDFECIPVIIHSTSIIPEDVDELKSLGAADHLVKRFDSAKLKEEIIKYANLKCSGTIRRLTKRGTVFIVL